MPKLDALVAVFAMPVDEFASVYRGLFFVPAARVGPPLAGTVRSTPAARQRGDVDDTVPHPGHDAASYWLTVPRAPPRLPLIAGRAPTSDLVIVHPSVSRRHAALTPSDAFIEIEDLTSQHGTLVRGRKLRGGERAVVAVNEAVGFADVQLALVDARGYWRAARGTAG